MYLEQDVDIDKRTINPSKHNNRMLRGFNSLPFARLMCPHKHSAEFAKDPDRCVFAHVLQYVASHHRRVMIELREGIKPVTGGDYPKVFFSEDYDQRDLLKGFMRSKELVLVCIISLNDVDSDAMCGVVDLEAHLYHPHLR